MTRASRSRAAAGAGRAARRQVHLGDALQRPDGVAGLGRPAEPPVRLTPDVLASGKETAAARGLDFNRYVERLIAEDTTGARAAGVAAAQRLIDLHGDFLDGLEEALDARRAPTADRCAAA